MTTHKNAPVVEAPVVEAPVVEAPVVEAPVVEAPVVEAPVVEAPVVEAPVVEAPVILIQEAVENLRISINASNHSLKSQIETSLNTIESYLRF